MALREASRASREPEHAELPPEASPAPCSDLSRAGASSHGGSAPLPGAVSSAGPGPASEPAGPPSEPAAPCEEPRGALRGPPRVAVATGPVAGRGGALVTRRREGRGRRQGLNRPMGEPRAAAARRRPRKCGGGGSGSYPWCCLQPPAAPRNNRGLYGSAARRLAAAGEDSLRRQRLSDAAFGPSW